MSPIPAHLRLSELNLTIKSVLEANFERPIWVVAEVAKVNSNYSGHTYIDLVEKRGAETLAQAKSTVWRSNNRILTEYARVTGAPLRAGMQILLQVRVDYHPSYGLSLNIQQIDTSYTLGEMARKRQEVLDRLSAEGLLERNCSLPMVVLPQRVAVISSATAAGWEDFRARLEDNPYGYYFELTLFTATMQGDGAEASVIAALEQIRNRADAFDVITILRGGGGVVDLSCFDSYGIAHAIAISQMPVITGIGHERDTSVADIVAHHRADTPTAAAEYLIGVVYEFDSVLTNLTESLAMATNARINSHTVELADLVSGVVTMSSERLKVANSQFGDLVYRAYVRVRQDTSRHHQAVTALATRISLRSGDYTRSQTGQLREVEQRFGGRLLLRLERADVVLNSLEANVRLRDPANILRRGFSITRVGGQSVQAIDDVPVGAQIETTFAFGKIVSRVEEKAT